MSVDNFKPEIWSRDILFQFRTNRAFGALTNTNYQGEITGQGDTVRITQPTGLTVGSYAGTDISFETIASTQQSLLIDQAKYVAFDVDDVDAAQANVDLLGTYTQEAGEALADDADEYIASLYTDAQTTVGGALTESNVYGFVVDAATALSDLKVPMTGRVAVVSPGFHGILTKSPEFISASDLGDAVKQSGAVGQIAGFTIFQGHSVVVDSTGDEVEHNLFGHPASITFAQQISSLEAGRRENRFADFVKGLNLYGAKVIRPEALVDVQRNTA